jgi:methylthioribose-1-phosphate isomerase
MVETIQWTAEGVVMIDQTRLPRETVFVTCRTYLEVAEAIRGMVIRGAPAIGVAAAMGMALGVLGADPAKLDPRWTGSRRRWGPRGPPRSTCSGPSIA